MHAVDSLQNFRLPDYTFMVNICLHYRPLSIASEQVAHEVKILTTLEKTQRRGIWGTLCAPHEFPQQTQ